MKIIFDKEEDMNWFIRDQLSDLKGLLCVGHFISPPTLEECFKYDVYAHDKCLQCFKDHNIELTYVKSCTECAKTLTCKNYYRNDLISKLGTCSPISK